MIGHNTDLQNQIELLTKILAENHPLFNVIEGANRIGLKDYYIGAGCIAQTVWNYQLGLELTHGISDIDFAYYDSSDLSFEEESTAIDQITHAIGACEIKLDIKNQARVHLWYKDHFGYDIAPYPSLESAINTWPTTATAVGVRLERGKLKVYAPFGLNDLFGMIVRANKTQITEEIYLRKVKKWREKWPGITVMPW